MSFEALKLRPELLVACKKQGFKAPTPIQAIVVPVALKGRDVVVEAKTGSGKTLAYGWPLLEREPSQTLHPEALVIVPTRELAQQIEADLVKSAGKLERPVVLLVGGASMDKQIAGLKAGAPIAVGTLGRIEELVERKLLRLDFVRSVVLDEVDELLKGGFSGNLAGLLSKLPKERQTMLFSATIPTEVEAVAKQFTRDAARLRVSAAREQPAELTHRVLFTSVDDRIGDLVQYLKATKPYQAVIFCGTRHETEEVNEAVKELGLESEYLHGELSANKRKQLLERVRTGDLPVLVASDLAARGLDLPGVDLVVNYSLPKGSAAYLHRAGRTGRAGRKGVVLSMVIEQQHEVFEKLKPSFPFESTEVFQSGKVIRRTLKTREERDLQYRKLPPRTWEERQELAKAPARKKPAPRLESPPPPQKDFEKKTSAKKPFTKQAPARKAPAKGAAKTGGRPAGRSTRGSR